MVDEHADVFVSGLTDDFFHDILPAMDDTHELKAVLYIAWLASRSGCPATSFDQLLDPPILRAIVGIGSPEQAADKLRRALDRAVSNGAVLRVKAGIGDGARQYFLVATPSNRELLERLDAADVGRLLGLDVSDREEISRYRPNVFAVYERLVGPLTPLVAEQIRDAERSYPREWVEQAILMAVNYNKRNWRYMQTILNEWEKTGGPDGVPRGRA
ncbi:MAG: DnaD domain-containing protein [Chloroflexota bacterium]|nr:MAG: hypothetical protein DLM70_18200 [Chloroflexota bacterium]